MPFHSKGILFYLVLLLFAVGLAFLCILGMSRRRGQKEVSSETGVLTMNADRGAGQEYYSLLQKELSGMSIPLELECAISTNTTINNENRIAHDDAPDIITMASPLPAHIQLEKLLDLTQYTFLDGFRSKRIGEISLNGAVYQVPYTSKLIGIQYNRTLFREMGWTPPKNYAELLALIPKIREAGYHVTTTAINLTGHGFNYLFHFAGVTALSTPAGSAWLEDFLAGRTEDMTPIRQTVEYIQKLIDCGFFDSICLSSPEYFYKSRRNSAFYLDVINYPAPYSGWLLDQEGLVVDGKYEEDATGSYVLLDGRPRFYDSHNPAHEGLTRYRVVDGRRISDEYGTMPWIGEDGTNNCFCLYDNFYVSLNRRLEKPEEKQKLEKALCVLDTMARGALAEFPLQTEADVYLSLNSFQIDESRSYYEYRDSIQAGYTMPWYYSRFSSGVINQVGEVMNDWIQGKRKADGTPYSGEDVIQTLLKTQRAYLASGDASVHYAYVRSDFSFRDTATFLAYGIALAAQQYFDKTPEAGKMAGMPVSVALMPYSESRKYSPYGVGGICRFRLYQGDLTDVNIGAVIPQNAGTVDAVLLTGRELRELLNNGLDLHPETQEDAPFPYACVMRKGLVFQDDVEYLVAVASTSLPLRLKEPKMKGGKYFACKCPIQQGIILVAKEFQAISPDDMRRGCRDFEGR